MAEAIQDKVLRSLGSANESYNRLVLLVGASGSGKTDAIREIAERLNAQVININLALSEKLLELTPKQRALRLPQILSEIIENSQAPTVLLDNLEVLFDSQLKQDPLRLLQGISRNRSVLASWNGVMDGNKLKYAETGHPEHRSYEIVDTLIVAMDGSATIDGTRSTKGN